MQASGCADRSRGVRDRDLGRPVARLSAISLRSFPPGTIMASGMGIADLRNKIDEGWNGIRDSMSTTDQHIVNTVASSWNSINSAVSAQLGLIGPKVSSTWANMQTDLTNRSNNITSAVSSAWNGHHRLAHGHAQQLTELRGHDLAEHCQRRDHAKPARWSAMSSNAWNGISNGVGSAIENVKTTILNKFQEITNWLGGLYQTFFNAGTNIWTGMVNGLNSLKVRVQSAVSGPLQALIDVINSLLDMPRLSSLCRRWARICRSA